MTAEATCAETVIGADEFRRAMRMQAAAVSLLCTELHGSRYGIAVTSLTGLTAEPPQILVCVNRTASVHAPILARGAFSINVLAQPHLGLAKAFGGELPPSERFARGSWTESRGGLPLLRGALLAAEAELVQTAEVATHTVLIGRLKEVDIQNGEPLLFLNRSYGAFDSVFPARTDALLDGSFY